MLAELFFSEDSGKEYTSKVILDRIQFFMFAELRSSFFLVIFAGGCSELSRSSLYSLPGGALCLQTSNEYVSCLKSPLYIDSPIPLSDGENILPLMGFYD